MKFKEYLVLTLSLLLPAASSMAMTGGFNIEDKNIQSFIGDMVKQHQFDRQQLTTILSKARIQQSILDAIARPAEQVKPWYEYRAIFLTRNRIQGGVTFWKKNQQVLEAAQKKFQVPAYIITAIIGVETRYGRHIGSYSVLDSLATLAFAYPPRSRFFRGELEQFLLMSREENIDPTKQLGSYAGAMGMPQFIASSFRSYAVDFDNNGQRDLWKSPADAIGSVANYFHRHGWQYNQPVIQRVQVKGSAFRKLISENLKPSHTIAELRKNGVVIPKGVDDKQKAVLLELEGESGPEYWLAWHNFYVISRYNHSALYSLAVYQLSQKVMDALK